VALRKISELTAASALDRTESIEVVQGGNSRRATVQAILNSYGSVLGHGAVGDGVTDDASAFQTAVDVADAAGGGWVTAPPGDYLIGQKVILRPNVGIFGYGRATRFIVGVNDELFGAYGSITTGEGNTLASNSDAGSLTVVLSSGKGANFSAGDWALIRSEADSVCPQSSQKNGELVKVRSISTDTLTLEGPLNFAYATADSAEVQKISMVESPVLRDFLIFNPDPTNFTGGMSEFLFCHTPEVNGVIVEGGKNSGFSFQGCVGHAVLGCRGADLKSQTTTPTGFGYFVFEAGANVGLRMSDCYTELVRHTYTSVEGKSFAGVTLGYGVPVGSAINNCTALNPRAAGFDTHEEGLGITFTNCHVIGGQREGFQDRAVDTTFDTCKVNGAVAEGFQFHQTIRAKAINCTAYRTNKGTDPETSVDATTTGAFLDEGNGTHLRNCYAVESGHHGFEFIDHANAVNPTYEGCHAIDIGQDGTNPAGFYIGTTQSTTVILKDCIARDSAGNMLRGFDKAVSSNPTAWADGCYSEGHTGDPFNGTWNVQNNLNSTMVGIGIGTTLTIASGAIDINESPTGNIIVAGEGGVSDDLVTINGGNNGQQIYLRRDADDVITIKHGTGNILVNGGADFVLDNALDGAFIVRIGGNWIVVTPVEAA
jgi:hypothetical protein